MNQPDKNSFRKLHNSVWSPQ